MPTSQQRSQGDWALSRGFRQPLGKPACVSRVWSGRKAGRKSGHLGREGATQWPPLSLCGQGWGYQLPGFPALAEEASLRPSSPPQARPLCPHACLALLDTGLALEVLRHRLEPRCGARATWSSALGTGGVAGPVPPPQAVRGLQAERKWWGWDGHPHRQQGDG